MIDLLSHSATVDFSGAIQTVTIMAGSNEACANIAIVDDNIQEGPEQFCVQVGIVGEAVPNSEVSGTPGCQICVTINDPQSKVLVQLSTSRLLGHLQLVYRQLYVIILNVLTSCIQT